MGWQVPGGVLFRHHREFLQRVTFQLSPNCCSKIWQERGVGKETESAEALQWATDERVSHRERGLVVLEPNHWAWEATVNILDSTLCAQGSCLVLTTNPMMWELS